MKVVFPFCIVLIITIGIWLWRIRPRTLKSLEEELDRIEPVPTEELGEICYRFPIDTAFDATRNEAARQVFTLGDGIQKFRRMEAKSRILVRILQIRETQQTPFGTWKDTAYITAKTAQFRSELPMVFLEWLISFFSEVPPLHTLRAANLYCEASTCLQEAAAENPTEGVQKISAAL